MARMFDDVLDDAMQLGDDERSRLAAELLHSVQSEEERTIEREWLAVAKRRMDEIDAGTAKTVSFEDAIEHARKALNDARSRAAR